MRKIYLALCLLACIILSPVAYSQNINQELVGFSGYIVSEEELYKTLSYIDITNSNTYRVSFKPSWMAQEGEIRGYNTAYIDHLLVNTDLFIIVNGNHLYPPREQSLYAQSHWDKVRDRVFQTLQNYPNNSRVAVELVNEYTLSDYDKLIQELIDEIRNASYTNPIVTNKFEQNWTKFNDTLDATYQGMHFYFNHWSVSGAIEQMQMAKQKNITLLLNTEIGASSYEYTNFNQKNVDALDSFLLQSQALGVNNLIWINNDTQNLEAYRKYELSLLPTPTPTPPPTQTPTHAPTITPQPTPPNPTKPSITEQNLTNTPTPTPNPTQDEQEQKLPTQNIGEGIYDNILIAATAGIIAIASTGGALVYFKRNKCVRT